MQDVQMQGMHSVVQQPENFVHLILVTDQLNAPILVL